MIIDKGRKTWLLVADGETAALYAVHTHPWRLEALPDIVPRAGHHGGASQGKERGKHRESFAALIADGMSRAVAGKAVDDLLIVAPPHTIGDLRRAMDPATHEVVRKEISGEWTHMPSAQLLEALRDHLTEVHIS